MQRWNRALAALACLLFFNACGAQDAETTADATATTPAPLTSATETTIETVAPPEETTEMTEETTIETTAETTAQTTPETTATAAATAGTTAAKTIAETTEATAAMTAPSVREGEYPEGETVIENIDGFTYVNGILIANKTYLLPADYDFFGGDRTLDTHVKLLRKSLGRYSSYIVTLRGVGYRYSDEA